MKLSLLVLILCALAVGACGGDDEGGGEEAAQPTQEQTAPQETGTVETTPEQEPAVEARESEVALDEFSFSPDDLQVERGVELQLANVGSLPHNLTIERGTDPSVPSETLAASPTLPDGDNAEFTVDVEPGTYSIVCTVGNHREQGMVGTIEVTGG